MHADSLVNIRLTYGDWIVLGECLERYSGRPTCIEYCPEAEQPIIERFYDIVDNIED
jgi:hypothetical protein